MRNNHNCPQRKRKNATTKKKPHKIILYVVKVVTEVKRCNMTQNEKKNVLTVPPRNKTEKSEHFKTLHLNKQNNES